VVSVPPVLLPREVYWPVKAGKQIALQITRGAPSPAVAPVAAAPAPPAAEEDPVAEAVLAVVAKVSAYPRAAVSLRQSLVGDLGFDSLMIADLANGIAEAFPGIGGIPQDLLVERPTVGAIVDWARVARTGAARPADDDAPLAAWTPVWRTAALPDAVNAVAGKRVSVGGSGRWLEPLRAGLTADGAVRDDASPELLVWVCDAADPVPPAAVVAGRTAVPDPAGPFLARLDDLARQVGAADVIVVRRSDDPWAEAVTGAVRAISREWPDRLVKSVSVDGRISAADLLSRVIAEHGSADRTVDVRWTSTARAVLGLEPALSEEPTPIGPDDVVLVTGGTRGIGARLAERAVAAGARVLVAGRTAGQVPAGAVHLAVDVLDRRALCDAVAAHGTVTVVIHAAGTLADGPLGQVDPAAGERARRVKIEGWLHALAAAPHARVALGLGSWAGRFGNRHQAHYAAGNAGMAGLAATWTHSRAVVSELGPWTSSAMARSIPAAVQAAMRADGVDFVGDRAGLDALWSDLSGFQGISVRGRDLPWTTRVRRATEVLAVDTHPFLADHAIGGVPVLPLAAAADLIAWVAAIPAPFELLDLTLFSGVVVREPTPVEVVVRGERAEIRTGERRQLAYRARIRPLTDEVDVPAASTGGAPSPLPLADFYGPVAFHGPLLRGLDRVDALGDGFARGVVHTGVPTEWIPRSMRKGWVIDPLALDSAMQLSGLVAWVREKRAGTPIGIRRLAVLAPLTAGALTAEVRFDPATAGAGDRWTGTLILRDARGRALLMAEDTAAELRKSAEAPESAPPLALKPEWTNAALWPAVQDLRIRLEMAQAVGMRNPYFAVHEGTARNTTVVGGRELVNFSSYNYVGLSGDPRVVAATCAAVERYGTSVSASRVASGERPFHRALERELAAAQGAEDALVFTAGHATNVTTIGHLFGKGDLILHDELIHDSALQGIKLSGAARRGFRHDDPAHLEQLLLELRPHHEKCLIVVEGVYSMDGDIPDLPAVVALKQKHGCLLMVDEAHSFGVIGATGRGIGEHFGIDGRAVDLWMGTLSKSLASCGGWIAGPEPLIAYLRYTAPGFVYSAGLTPANGVAALTALRLMLDEPWRVARLQANGRTFWNALRERGVDTGPARGGSGVVPAVTGNSLWALQLSSRLLDAGVNVQPIVYPAVADDAARLRFFLSSTHTDDELVRSAAAVAENLAAVRAAFPIP
jgi:8-amino-7-oxononanoate synthase